MLCVFTSSLSVCCGESTHLFCAGNSGTQTPPIHRKKDLHMCALPVRDIVHLAAHQNIKQMADTFAAHALCRRGRIRSRSSSTANLAGQTSAATRPGVSGRWPCMPCTEVTLHVRAPPARTPLARTPSLACPPMLGAQLKRRAHALTRTSWLVRKPFPCTPFPALHASWVRHVIATSHASSLLTARLLIARLLGGKDG